MSDETNPPHGESEPGRSPSPIDLLFYGIAVYEGYKLSFRRLSEEQIAQVLAD